MTDPDETANTAAEQHATGHLGLTDNDRLLITQARGLGPALRASTTDRDRLAGWLLKELADLAERQADAAYVAEHGSDDLETGYLRDPEGDEAAHG